MPRGTPHVQRHEDAGAVNGYSDPRWLPFLRSLGKAPDQLAKIPFRVPPADLHRST